MLLAVIALANPRSSVGVGVDRLEQVPAGLRLVLRLAGAQALRERVPEPEQPRVQHLQQAALVAGLGAVEEEVRLGRVAVLAVLALEHPERHQRVEEVARAARVKAEALAQRLGLERPRLREL